LLPRPAGYAEGSKHTRTHGLRSCVPEPSGLEQAANLSALQKQRAMSAQHLRRRHLSGLVACQRAADQRSFAGCSAMAWLPLIGGAMIAASAAQGVIYTRHKLFGHPRVYVVDAPAIPVNLGVNPSLTITALAERFASLIPPR